MIRSSTMNLPPPTPVNSRAQAGVSRLAMMQARIQAQQMMEKEHKLLQFLEDRQEAAIRRVAYGRDSSFSANSLSSTSTNSMNAGIGARPVPQRPGMVRNPSTHNTWEQRPPQPPLNNYERGNYTLKPVELTLHSPIYKRNSNASTNSVAPFLQRSSNNSNNKYSGHYGPNSDYMKSRARLGSRGVSLDRNHSHNSSPVRQPSQYALTRTRSQAALGHSSGEDSYGSSSRPPSCQHLLYNPTAQMTSSAYPSTTERNWPDVDDVINVPSSPRMNRKTSYTREYVRNLPSVAAPVCRNRFSRSQPRLSDANEHSSFSSQSSEKSDSGGANRDQSFPVMTNLHKVNAKSTFSTNNDYESLEKEADQVFKPSFRPLINSQTYRKIRSPSRGRSPDRRSLTIGGGVSEDTDANGNNLNNNSSSSNLLALQRQKEDEKRKLQIEMRRREQELLNKIKEQQKALENMKLEKNRYERELQKKEVLRDRELKAEEDKEREERVLKLAQDRRHKDAEEKATCAPSSRSRIRSSAIGTAKKILSRTSSNSTSKADDEDDTDDLYFRGTRSNYGRTTSLSRSRPPLAPTISQKVPTSPLQTRRISVSPRKSKVDASSVGANEHSAAGPGRRSIFSTKPKDDLVPCTNCGRCFAEDRVAKHTEICIKTSTKKRKTFDMTKKRLQGTDAEQFLSKTKKGTSLGMSSVHLASSKKGVQPKKNDWRKKREEFINALRAAKVAQRHLAAGGKISDLPPPPPMDTSDYIQCPHCGRKFNESAAERHIPKCKDIKSNKRR